MTTCRVDNVQDGFLDLTEIKTIEALLSDIDALRLQHGDVFMIESNNFNKLGQGVMWETDILDYIHRNYVFRVQCNCHNLLPVYLVNYIRTEVANNMASMNVAQLKAIPIACPPIDHFAAKIEQIARLGKHQERGRQYCDQLFDFLIQDAFTGEL